MSRPKRERPKLAFYWCASCGGCEEAVVDLGEALLDVAQSVDIVLWPAALDHKYSDLELLDDGAITASLINGAIRTDEQAEVARLLRRKSKVVVAYGACACDGGVPGLANLTSKKEIYRVSYRISPTVDNDAGRLPQPLFVEDGDEVTLPKFWDRVHALSQVIDVDYAVPGCAPTPENTLEALTAILQGSLPKRDSSDGTPIRLGSDRALCDTCPRRDSRKGRAVIDAVYQPHEIVAEPDVCLLEQGLLCCGPATRGGCGALCIDANMPCTGCYGPPPGVSDQGSKMLSAIATLFTAKTRRQAEVLAARVLDPAGTFYRYSLPVSLIDNEDL
jgi:F420-non-reducing hydrogenase small subunit